MQSSAHVNGVSAPVHRPSPHTVQSPGQVDASSVPLQHESPQKLPQSATQLHVVSSPVHSLSPQSVQSAAQLAASSEPVQ